MRDNQVCALHSPRGADIRAKATQASADARRDKANQREQATEDAKLTLTQRLTRAAAVRAGDLVDALIERAIDGDMRAQGLVWDRVEGKVADHLITEAGDPFQMSEEQLARWLAEPAPVPQHGD